MKTQISSLDLHYLIDEFQFLVGARVDKIYHPKKEELLLQLHVTGKGKQLLRIISGKFIFLSQMKENYEEPSGFCMYLRKKLGNARIRAVEQMGSERVAKISFGSKQDTLNLYVELFGKGNVVLTGEDDSIQNVLEQKRWKDRDIRKGKIYSYPKKDFDLFRLGKDEFFDRVSGKEIVLGLAKSLGLGGTYAEEICLRSGVDKNKKELSMSEKSRLYDSFKALLSQKADPHIYFEKQKIKDIAPFHITVYESLENRKTESLSHAFDTLFKDEIAQKEEFISKHQKEIDKIRKIIEQQNSQIKSLGKKAEEENKKGELIYENYQMIDEILQEINKARKKYSFDEIKKKLKGHKTIKDIDSKEKTVMIELS